MSRTINSHNAGGTLGLRSFVRTAVTVCILAVPMMRGVATAQNVTDEQLRSYADGLVPELPEFVQATLERIPDFRRRLLAMGTYFRKLESLESEWAWTHNEAADFKLTEEYARMLVEIEKVKQTFAERNPGYKLQVNIGARSLQAQLRSWNTVRSVRRSANDFADSCRAAMSDTLLFSPTPDSIALKRFRGFLERCELPEEGVPSVAVPGLSKHGQLRAFDFKIVKGGRLIAGTTTATIPSRWDEPGWTGKLREAIAACSDRFEGPLSAPYEPWHYTYLIDPVEKKEPVEDLATEGPSSTTMPDDAAPVE